MLKVEAIDLYYGASHALKKVSLEAGKGQVVCLMGRNGVGKTSMLGAIAGRQPVQQGSINWAGKNITRLPSFDRARSGIAYVPQGRQIFSQLTVLENLQTGFACLPNRDRFIDPMIYFLFPVLKDMLQRRGGDLSGGQQQQLAIARALVTRPQLLLLDEPTEGIQPSIIKEIQKVISTLRNQGEMAIVLVEQYFEFARDLADHFYVMDRGEIVLSGPAAEMEEEKVRALMTV
jgi:urea transport system ATP-binding protein